MGYFRELPNLLYQSFLPSKNSSLDYVEVKNLFRRTKLRDDLQNIFTIFTRYEIPEGYRPENVAEDFYGSDELDWVVLMSAKGPQNTSGILNVRNDWPISSNDLYGYALNKYGNNLNATRFYETKEIRDSKGHLILNADQVVDETFKSPIPTLLDKPVTEKIKNSSFIFEQPSGELNGFVKGDIIEPISTDTKSQGLYYTKTENYGNWELNLPSKTWTYRKIITAPPEEVFDTLSYTTTDGNKRTITVRIKTDGTYEDTVPDLDKGSGFVAQSYIQYWDETLGYNVVKYGTDVRSGVSNWIYETKLNDKKRSIYLLKPEYLQQFLNDFRDIMVYNESSEYIRDDLIKTENTNITMP